MRFIRYLTSIGILACGLLAGPAGAAIPDSERAVLANLYASTGGDHWSSTVNNLHKWFVDDTDPCIWFGITCDAGRAHVIVISLSNNNLVGQLPGNLADLNHLRGIVVDANRLSGPFPALTGLTSLEAVIAGHNQFTGPIPSLAGLTNLGYFAIDHNQLTGPIPRSVSDLPGLQYFVVDSNLLSGRVPKAPATLTQFGAALCPNSLDTRPSTDPAIDASWNAATGLTPWWSGPGEECAVPAADAAAPHAFTTSTTGTGDLHGWSEVSATGLTGLAAADGICQARATAADLLNPGEYVAWLSDRENDAYCRVFGLSGKKADNCGLAELPVGAGPWLRTDNVPFADTIGSALDNNVVYSTLNVDESGTPLPDSLESFTATDRDGTFITKFDNNADCERWTTTLPTQTFGSTPALGSTLASSGDWTFDEHGAGCNSRHRLTCLQKGSAPALIGHGQPGQREAFLTSANVSGNLGGIAGADAMCRSAAAAAHLHQPDSFKALITSAALGANIIDRFEFDGPWYRRDGLIFAHNKAELIGGAVTLPLNVTETGAYSGIAVALTGARPDGTPSGHDCGNWSQDSQESLARGALANTIAFYGNIHDWLGPADVSCASALAPNDWPRKLFCLSDSDVLFHGEFDTVPESP